MKWITDIRLRTFTLIITIVTVFISVHQFNKEQRNIKELELQKLYTIDSLKVEEKLREKRVEIYFKISETVGAILAHDHINETLLASIERYETIYYGEALTIEDLQLNKAMFNFKISIEDYLNEFITKEKLNRIGMKLIAILKQHTLNEKSVYK